MDETDLFQSTTFDPEIIKIFCDAYDIAHRSLHDSGQPDVVNQIIAQRIISLARQGERDPDKLCEYALKAVGNKAVFER